LPPEIRSSSGCISSSRKRLNEELMSAEIKEDENISELSVALFDSLAFQEGLEWGVKDYDLGSKEPTI
jgi:hypothetical protein